MCLKQTLENVHTADVLTWVACAARVRYNPQTTTGPVVVVVVASISDIFVYIFVLVLMILATTNATYTLVGRTDHVDALQGFSTTFVQSFKLLVSYASVQPCFSIRISVFCSISSVVATYAIYGASQLLLDAAHAKYLRQCSTCILTTCNDCDTGHRRDHIIR